MGSKLSRLAKSPKTTKVEAAQVLEINVQPGPSRPRSNAENGDFSNALYHQNLRSYSSSSSSSESNLSSSSFIHRKLSIVSIISTDSEIEDSLENRRKKRQQKKDALLKPGEAVDLTDLSIIDPAKEKARIEAETTERLFREEQERLEKEKRQERAKTARLKRRSELYGSANIPTSPGTNGVQPAESVLRLIGSGNSGPDLLSIASRNVQKYISSLPLSSSSSTGCCKPYPIRENSALQRKPILTLPGTPMPTGSHRPISRLIESEKYEAETVSRSGQYVRNVNKRSSDGKKLSPLVSKRGLHERIVLKSSTKGQAGQKQTWRMVPLMNSSSTNKPSAENTSSTIMATKSSSSRQGVLPVCPSSNTKAGLLLEGNLTMNKIEKFLETRDHIDKTEFDMVVRNLIEDETTESSSARKKVSKRNFDDVIHEPSSQPRQQQAPTTSLLDFPMQPKTNIHENVFVAAPYHPAQSKFYGKNKFFEPAAYVTFPNMTASSSKGGMVTNTHEDKQTNKPGKQRRQYGDGSKSSMKSERSEKSQKEKPPSLFSNEVINAESLISSFNGTRSKSLARHHHHELHSSPPSSGDVPLAFVKGLPPVSTVPLVTRACTGADNRPRNLGSLGGVSNRHSGHHQHQYQYTADTPCAKDHAVNEYECEKCCGRPPSRGGRVLMEWLHSKRRSSM